MSEPIECAICGGKVHAIKTHLKKDHAETTLEMYREQFPTAPLMSELMKQRLQEAQQAVNADTQAAPTPAPAPNEPEENTVTAMATSAAKVHKLREERAPMHQLFNLDVKSAEATNQKGDPIMIPVLDGTKDRDLIPTVADYVFDAAQVKHALLAIELNVPLYVWGHKGTGKTEMVEQICARTNRPMLRVQHTVNTEESHIVGQWTARGGETLFELGPLPLAMINGWLYLADEYDFGLPNVLGVYQSVLEGKALVIKQADAANRIIKPHKDFRFVGTGNTNGAGDETGLYQGTSIQNSANYDRFGCVIHKEYMSEADESRILIEKCNLHHDDARDLTKFAKQIREAYASAKISDLITPRSLLNAARFGVILGSFKKGVALAFTNKLNSVDQEVVNNVAGRIFGS